MVAMGSLFIVNGKSDSTASPNLSTASSPPHTHHTPHISHTQHTSPPPPPPPIQSAFSPFNPQPENRHHHRSSSSSNNNIISHTHSRNHSHSHSRSHSNGQSYSYNYNQSQTQNQNQNYHQQYETDPPIKMLTKDILLQPNFDRHSSRRKREMQAVTKIVETREFPYNDNYFWKNNGNTTHKKNGCRSIYYKCSNSSKGCSVNKTVAAKEDGYYVIKYRGEHQKECGHVEHIRDL
ncbi:hypothetical protein J3Q64DRAFT_1743204 [Phycomyces blakesleeanus]|uniref:WRKY domain-containing protein n=1 Tax=Phycomyces blakesleeanus TaxID=4837 RepID=A0ABR3B1T4_PHYBL